MLDHILNEEQDRITINRLLFCSESCIHDYSRHLFFLLYLFNYVIVNRIGLGVISDNNLMIGFFIFVIIILGRINLI